MSPAPNRGAMISAACGCPLPLLGIRRCVYARRRGPVAPGGAAQAAGWRIPANRCGFGARGRRYAVIGIERWKTVLAAIQARLHRQEDVADALLIRAFRRFGQPPPTGGLVARIIALARLAAEAEPAVSELAERVAAQALAASP